MRVALVHEWLTEKAGSEQVVEQLLALWPQADLHAMVDTLTPQARDWLQGRPVTTSWLQSLPATGHWFRALLPLFPQVIERFDLDGYDLVLSSHHCVAKGVMTRADQVHVSYVHSPMRYAWDLQHRYLGGPGAGRWLHRQAALPFLHALRTWDVISAHRVDRFVANSATVAARIRRCWRREASVVHPPVDTGFFTPGGPRGDYFLHAGRLVGYKRADLAVAAFARLPRQRLVVAGDGPGLPALRRGAPANVQFVGRPSGPALRDLLRGARALVFCAEEDFGILPVEAMACGTPVIAYGRGGATETVQHGETGLHFPYQDVETLMRAIEEFTTAGSWDSGRIRQRAEEFSIDRFHTGMRREVAAALADGPGRLS
jgi:glycosyltransferase involved in cell wall biosynthesis